MFAKSIDEIKQDLIDHLATIDKTKLNIIDLSTYTIIVKTVDDMMRPDPSEVMAQTMATIKDSCWYATDKPKAGVIDG